MIVLVSDTSVLIDLERGGLLEAAFTCGLTLAVPDYLYEQELAPYNGQLLRSLGLSVVELSPDELSEVQLLHGQKAELSMADCFALVCGARPLHALVTGDRVLRAEAESRSVEVYGLLWLMDQLLASDRVPATLLHEGLTRISSHPRCRLPATEVRARLTTYARRPRKS